MKVLDLSERDLLDGEGNYKRKKLPDQDTCIPAKTAAESEGLDAQELRAERLSALLEYLRSERGL